jgi:hypothetical protein
MNRDPALSSTSFAAVNIKAQRAELHVRAVIVDKEDYRQMLSQRGGEGAAIDDW